MNITGFFSVAKPYSCATLGWLLNWPLMTASLRKKTSSSKEESSCSSRTATSFSPVEECQSPLCTIPNVSERRYDRILCRKNTAHIFGELNTRSMTILQYLTVVSMAQITNAIYNVGSTVQVLNLLPALK